MIYYLLIIPIAILSLFARVIYLNRNKDSINNEPKIVVDEYEFYDDNLD